MSTIDIRLDLFTDPLRLLGRLAEHDGEPRKAETVFKDHLGVGLVVVGLHDIMGVSKVKIMALGPNLDEQPAWSMVISYQTKVGDN